MKLGRRITDISDIKNGKTYYYVYGSTLGKITKLNRTSSSPWSTDVYLETNFEHLNSSGATRAKYDSFTNYMMYWNHNGKIVHVFELE